MPRHAQTCHIRKYPCSSRELGAILAGAKPAVARLLFGSFSVSSSSSSSSTSSAPSSSSPSTSSPLRPPPRLRAFLPFGSGSAACPARRHRHAPARGAPARHATGERAAVIIGGRRGRDSRSLPVKAAASLAVAAGGASREPTGRPGVAPRDQRRQLRSHRVDLLLERVELAISALEGPEPRGTIVQPPTLTAPRGGAARSSPQAASCRRGRPHRPTTRDG